MHAGAAFFRKMDKRREHHTLVFLGRAWKRKAALFRWRFRVFQRLCKDWKEIRPLCPGVVPIAGQGAGKIYETRSYESRRCRASVCRSAGEKDASHTLGD